MWKSKILNFSQISSDDSGLGEIQNSEDEQTDSEVVILDDSGLKSTELLSITTRGNRPESGHMNFQNSKLQMHSSFVVWNLSVKFLFSVKRNFQIFDFEKDMEYSEDDLLDIINGITGSGDETGNDQTDTGSKKPDSADIISTDSPEGLTTDKNDAVEPRNENEDDSKIHENKKTNLLNNLNDKFDDIDRMLDVSQKKPAYTVDLTHAF